MKKGFTLIELLVVVLIIGILTAVALPQYRKAVIKSKVVEAMVTLNALEKAQIVFHLENGYYAENLEDLSIEVDREGLVFTRSYAMKFVADNIRLEWAWGWGIADEKHRCLADTELTQEVCASYGGRNFRTGVATQYWTIP